jgi:uncharacterized protein YbaP (TraB family)
MGDGFRARRVRSWLGLGALVALGTAAPAASVPGLAHDQSRCARPALWVVSDDDTTIYLFGTIHTHDGRAHWFDHAVRRAFDASDSLVLETLVPPAASLRGKPSAGSGLATARETIGTARALGLRVELGADLVLHRAADAAGKPVIGLESFGSQLDMYRSLPAPARPATPAAASAGAASVPGPALAPFLRSMVDSWNKGDAAPIEAVVGAVRVQSPEAYRRLFSSRNASWAEWIDLRLERPGTVFLAVGSGHLVGRDSVQAKLLQRGIRSGRIN